MLIPSEESALWMHETRDPEAVRIEKLVVAFAYAQAVAAAVFAGLFLITGPIHLTWVCLGAAFVALGIRQLLRFVQSRAVLANLLAGNFYWSFFLGTYLMGGALSPVNAMEVAVPVLAICIAGLRWGAVWTVLLILKLIFFQVLYSTGYPLFNYLPTDESRLIDACAIVAAMSFMFVLILWYEEYKQKMLDSVSVFRRFAEASGQGMGWTDLEGRIQYMNPALCRMCEQDRPEDSLGEDVAKYVDEETRQRLTEEIFPAILREGGWSGELDIHGAKGGMVPTLSGCSLLLDKEGAPVFYACVFADMTERKRAEERLQESETRYCSMLAAVTSYRYSVWLEDGVTQSTEHGSGCLAVTGYAPREYAADPMLWLSMIHPEDRDPVLAQTGNLLEGQVASPIEHRIIHRDGGVRWVRSTLVPHRDEKGASIRYDGLVEDITERKQAEQTLREGELRFRTVADYTYDWEYWRSPKGEVVYVSPSCERITGHSPAEFRANPELFAEIIHPEDRALWRDHEHPALSAGEMCGELEFRISTKAGETRWIGHVCRPVHNKEGKFLGVRGGNCDITQRKQAEEHITRQAAVLQAINDVFREALTCETEEELGKTCLAVAERLTGSKFGLLGELNAAGLMDTIAISNPGWDACEMAVSDARTHIRNMPIRGIYGWPIREGRSQIVNGDEIATHPDRVGTPEGHPPIAAFLGVPLKHKGKVIGMIGLGNKESGYDTADQEAVESLVVAIVEALHRKRAEAEARAYATQLEVRNLELAAAKEEIEKTAANLERSNKELDDFAYVASHDLKEPLRGIQNYATFLLEDYADKLDEDGRAKLETLPRLAQRLESFIDSLLQFSRLGRTALGVQETDLNDLLVQVFDSLHVALEESGVDVRVPRTLPKIQCDRTGVTEILHNLVTNAIKYNDKTEKWIEIGHTDGEEVRLPDGQRPAGFVFYVRDNGIGIREKYFASVFRIFKRLHSRDKFGGGTGAGLTIVKKIVERHGGLIWIESTPSEGTTFYFTLQEISENDHHYQA